MIPDSLPQSDGDRMYQYAEKPVSPAQGGMAAPAALALPAASTQVAGEPQSAPVPAQAISDEAQTLAGQVGDPQPSIHAQLSVDELVNQDQTLAQRLYGDGSMRPDSPEGYDSTLAGGAFDRLEQQARVEANQEDVQALAEGRKGAAAVMHEFGVPKEEAGEIVRELGSWHQRAPLSEDANWGRKVKALGELEKEWGRETHARIELAKRTAAEACKRMPWLADLLKAGAGNDPKLIKRFAEIGLRQARRASKVGNNRNG